MAYSVYETTGDGSTVTFPINFTLGFNSRNEVTCQVNNEVDGLGTPVYRTLTWINDGLVTVGGAVVPLGVPIVFRRTVSKTALIHDYANGEAIEEVNLDETAKQTMMALHEILDGRIALSFNGLNMQGQRIRNLAPAIDSTDAVNLQQLDDATGGGVSLSYIDVSGTQAEDDVLLWDTTAVKFTRRPITELLSGVPDNSVSTAKIQDGAVTLAKLAANSVNGSKIASGTDLSGKSINYGLFQGSVLSGVTANTPAPGSNSTAVATTAFVNGALSAGVPQGANQSAMETETDTTQFISPSVIKYSPRVAKAGGSVTFSAGTPTLSAGSFGVASITETATGKTTINLSVTFSSANYQIDHSMGTAGGVIILWQNKTTTSFEIWTQTESGGSFPFADIDFDFTVFGDLA